jgi:hypothetical protein
VAALRVALALGLVADKAAVAAVAVVVVDAAVEFPRR